MSGSFECALDSPMLLRTVIFHVYMISLIHDGFSDFTVDPKISLLYDGLSGKAANFSLIYDGVGGEAAKLSPLQSLSLIYDVIV